MTKFSIIIPVYNAEKYIDQCISSLINQDYEQYELILVDDCSSDNSLEICKKYAEKYENVVVLNQGKNQGVSAARNRGIQSAKGNYILFADSDDFVAPEYFQTLDKLVEDLDFELICFGHYDYVVSETGEAKVSPSSMNQNISSNDASPWNKIFLNSFFASPWNKIFLRSILLQYNILFDTSCVCYEDYLFNVEYCLHVNRFKVIDAPLYYYRQFSAINHVSKRKWRTRFEISEKVARKTNEFISNHKEDGINNIRRYTYRSYLVELEASKLAGENYQNDLKRLLDNSLFIEAAESISPKGEKISAFLFFKGIHFDLLCKKILESLM